MPAVNFRIFATMPKYDGRDGLCGTRYSFVEATETEGWAFHRRNVLNETEGAEDYRFIVVSGTSLREIWRSQKQIDAERLNDGVNDGALSDDGIPF